MSAQPIDVTIDDDGASQLRHASMLKRGVDVVAGTVAIVILMPIFGAIAIAVRVSSVGPVLYRQQRVGRDGSTFEVLKFRTMSVGTHEEVLADPAKRDAYEANGWKLEPHDEHITRVGRWLRKTSLDELPQLFNVMSGEMSLVGVRPLLPAELALRSPYERMLYCSMRPGMTGSWQVEGRSSLDAVDRLQLDRTYVEQWSLRGDLLLLAKTPAAVTRVSRAR